MKAFPIDYNTASIDKWQGMDLRDYFAAKAMQTFDIMGFTNEEVAKYSYELADEMMKARQP